MSFQAVVPFAGATAFLLGEFCGVKEIIDL
jgi:hypothetical protein